VDGRPTVCVIPARGGLPSVLGGSEAVRMHPVWSPDGDAVAFTSERDGGLHIWVAAFADGRLAGLPRQLTFDRGDQQFPAWSPDGRRIAFVAPSSGLPEVWVTESDGHGQPIRVSSGAGAAWVRWHPGKPGIIVCGTWGGRVLTLRLLDPASGTVTDFRPPISVGEAPSAVVFNVSLDGRFVAFARANRSGDIWVTHTARWDSSAR